MTMIMMLCCNSKLVHAFLLQHRSAATTSFFSRRSYKFDRNVLRTCNTALGSLASSTSQTNHTTGRHKAYDYTNNDNKNNNNVASLQQQQAAVVVPAGPPAVSKKIDKTIEPCVGLMFDLTREHAEAWKDKGGIFVLAQGVVYWEPPLEAVEAMQRALASGKCVPDDGSPLMVHSYGTNEGLPQLVKALKEDVLPREYGLRDQHVMMTAGANQAYMNCVLTLVQDGDSCVVFRPFYFNHVMALQMCMSDDDDDRLLIGPSNDEGVPDVDWLREQFVQRNYGKDADDSGRIRLVTIANPGNPTGTRLARSTVRGIVDLCREYGCWLVLDCAYNDFIPQGDPPFDGYFDEPHVVHLFSFSKAYALAGYRCGYLSLHSSARGVLEQMKKVQDTIPIHASHMSQVGALGALSAGSAWVRDKVATLEPSRNAVRKALEPLDHVMGGSGAMYFMGKLPPRYANDDVQAARILVRDFGVSVIPGSFCGFPGWIRVCYSNLHPDKCSAAAERLGRGVRALMEEE